MFFTKLILVGGITLLLGGNAFAMNGGQNVANAKYPFYVYMEFYIYLFYDEHSHHSCGGSLIAPQWIVTAGVCVEKVDVAKVHLGIVNKADKVNARELIVARLKNNYYRHYKYDRSTLLNDIAIIKLPEPLKRSDHAFSIPLAPASAAPIPNGKEAIAISLGHPENNENRAKVLQFAKVKTVDLNTCENDLQRLLSKSSEICAKKDEFSLCTDDPGSPLVLDGKLIGIASKVSCKAGTVQRFVGIAAYTEWIQNAIKGTLYMG